MGSMSKVLLGGVSTRRTGRICPQGGPTDPALHAADRAEGISCWAAEVGDVARYYEVIQRDRIERACIDHGNFLGTNNDILTEANQTKYHAITDAYRIKKVIAWTFSLQKSMENYINPTNSYHADALLVGDASGQYLPWFHDDLDDFDAAINVFSSSQRKADSTDTVSFWERSGSDYVSGALIHVNSSDAADAGARQTGTKWEPYGPLMSGVNAVANGGRIILASVSLYSDLPVTLYPGVTRIDKRCRIEKGPGGASVRITRTR